MSFSVNRRRQLNPSHAFCCLCLCACLLSLRTISKRCSLGERVNVNQDGKPTTAWKSVCESLKNFLILWKVFAFGLVWEFGLGCFSMVRVRVGVIVRGEKCFRRSRNFDQLSVKRPSSQARKSKHEAIRVECLSAQTPMCRSLTHVHAQAWLFNPTPHKVAHRSKPNDFW